MTFDESERSDLPQPSWTRKEPNEEELSKETFGFTEDYLKDTRSVYDPESQTIRTDLRIGICSFCRKTLFEKDAAQCYYGDQIHASCALTYDGRPVCRFHVEVHIGGKIDAIVLSGISAGLDREQLKKLSGLPTDVIDDARFRLLELDYYTVRGYGLFSKCRITPIGVQSLNTMRDAFEQDPDFKLFLEKLRLIRSVETGAQ